VISGAFGHLEDQLEKTMRAIAYIAASAVVAAGGLAAVPQSAEAQSRAAPRGSYAQSCSAAYVNQGRLYADCRDTGGNTRPTSIELARCASSDIGNDNGLLVCQGVRGDFESGRGGGNNNGGGWGGNNNGGGWGGNNNGGGWSNNNGGRNTVTVYQDANFSGASQTFRGEVYNLADSGFNDVISSMQFRGEWEACTDANFRGQCQIFSDNVRNLDRWGMNDRISSIRPARSGGRW
jgi:hypothetical protein